MSHDICRVDGSSKFLRNMSKHLRPSSAWHRWRQWSLYIKLVSYIHQISSWVKKKKVKGRFMGPFQHCGQRPIVLLPQQFPAFIFRGTNHHTDARDLYQRRRELLPMNFVSKSVIHESTRFFYMPQSWDMG